MVPLLKIHSVPFSFEYQINDAKLEMQSPDPSYNLNRQEGGLQLKHTPAKIRIDSTAAKESMGLKSIRTATRESAQKGNQAALEIIGQYAREGNMMMDTRNKNVFGEISLNRTRSTVETMMGFIPSTPSQISFDRHQLDMRYQADKLSYDWKTSSKPKTNYTPASIDFKVKNYARVEIEYTGGPIYAPPSSSPDYVPPSGGLNITA